MEIRTLKQLRDLSSLSRAIFQADVPEALLNELPAQTLYQVVCYNGLESSVELIESAGLEQIRLLLDFDLWNQDGLDEEKLWSWIELTSEEDELLILQKIVSSLDLKIVALLINRYLEIRQNEEATDTPPGPLFYTPDKGLTWIRVLCDQQRQHFLMSKLLAFLFESNPDLFYQLLSTKVMTTPAVLEEEALNDRNKRLSSEGLPNIEFAAEVSAFLSVAEALEIIAKHNQPTVNHDIVIVEALARLSDGIEPLSSALAEQKNIEEILSELTLIVNSSFVRFGVKFSDNEQQMFMASQAQGALNIGLDLLSRKSALNPAQIIAKVGLQIPFRVGLTQLLDLSKWARRYEKKMLGEGIEIAEPTKALLNLVMRPFPCIPATLSQLKNDYAIDGENSLDVRAEPFRFFQEVENLKSRFTA